MLWVVCFFNYADRQAISSVLPLLARDFRFDPVQLGLIGSAFAWVYAALAPVAGVVADRARRQKVLVWACVAWSFFTLATAWCASVPMFLAVRALTGLGETFYFPAAMALISDYHTRNTRSRAMSWHQSAVYAGTVLGSWVAAVLAERHGWRAPFLVFGPVGLVLAVVLARWLREPTRGAAEAEVLTLVGTPRRGVRVEGAGDASARRPYPAACQDTSPEAAPEGAERLSIAETVGVILRTPAAMLLMTGFLCANFVAVMFLTWTPTYLVEKFHYAIGAAGLTGTLYIHLASALAVPLAGWLADRLVHRWAAGRMLVQTLGLAVGGTFILRVGQAGDVGALLAAMIGFGVCKGFYDSGIFASLYDVIEPRARGTAAGLMNTVGWAGGALGPLFFGYAAKYGGKGGAVANMSAALGLGSLFYAAAAMCVLGAMLLLPGTHRNRLPK